MLRVRDHGPVRELEMSSRASRLAGYKVSAFLHRGILVDTGFPKAGRDLTRWLDANPIGGAIVTHWHEDHSGNGPLLADRGVPVTMTEATFPRVRAAEPVAAYRRIVWGPPRPLDDRPRPAEHPFELVPTPGHTDDHVAVWDPKDRIAFVGDLFLGVKTAVVHPNEDPRAMVASLRRVVALEPAVVLDAHRSLLKDPLGLLRAKIDWLEATIGRIEELAGEGRDPASIRTAVLGPEEVITRMSLGEMSKLNFVRSVLGSRPERGA